MKRKAYTIECEEEPAGLVTHCPSTTEQELRSMLPGVTVYRVEEDEYMALSEAGPVRLVAHTHTDPAALHRLYVGIKDEQTQTIRLMPVLGSQVAELGVRLHDINYEDEGKSAVDLSDLDARRAVNHDLIATFGSTRRARQLGTKAEGRVLSSGVTSTRAISSAISEIAVAAAKEGLTTAQVAAKAAGQRNIPPHNPAATTAAEAFKFTTIVPEEHWDKLDWAPLNRAFRSAAALATVSAEHPQLVADPFVEHVLESRRAELLYDDAESRLTEASLWLALYRTCRSLLSLRRDTRLPSGSSSGRPDLAQKLGFRSLEAMQHFVSAYLTVVPSISGGDPTIYRSDQATRLLKLTLAVCAVRCNVNQVTPEMAAKLLVALGDLNLKEVMGLFREIGCKVKSVTSKTAGKCFSAVLLPGGGSENTTLQDCLPSLMQKKRAKAR